MIHRATLINGLIMRYLGLRNGQTIILLHICAQMLLVRTFLPWLCIQIMIILSDYSSWIILIFLAFLALIGGYRTQILVSWSSALVTLSRSWSCWTWTVSCFFGGWNYGVIVRVIFSFNWSTYMSSSLNPNNSHIIKSPLLWRYRSILGLFESILNLAYGRM